jgi:ornithine decarboxylase
LEKVKENFSQFIKLFGVIKPYYAVKANPSAKIVALLNKLGSNFDCASINEIKICTDLGISARKISFGNTVKKSDDIKKAFKLGVKLFAFDCEEELLKIRELAPRSNVYCRLEVYNGGAEWPLSKKFGCSSKELEYLLIKAKEIGLNPVGLSFHVGSQQLSKQTWEKAIKTSSQIYKKFKKKYFELGFLNIGGGMPENYDNKKIDIKDYAKNILDQINKYYDEVMPENIIAEPGRFLVAGAGVLESEVILIKEKEGKRWLYLDVGRYSGLAETEGEAIKYKIEFSRKNKAKKVKYIIAGPSCDSHDILYQKKLYTLPKNIKAGDRLRIFSAGSYIISYQSEFNGIKKIKEIFLK